MKRRINLTPNYQKNKEITEFLEKMQTVLDAIPMIDEIKVIFGAYNPEEEDQPMNLKFEVIFDKKYEYLKKELERAVLSVYLESKIIKVVDEYNDGSKKYVETRPEFKILNNVALSKYSLLNIKEILIPTKIEEKNDFNSNLERLKKKLVV